jgi:hypothetical protein
VAEAKTTRDEPVEAVDSGPHGRGAQGCSQTRKTDSRLPRKQPPATGTHVAGTANATPPQSAINGQHHRGRRRVHQTINPALARNTAQPAARKKSRWTTRTRVSSTAPRLPATPEIATWVAVQPRFGSSAAAVCQAERSP